MAHRFAALLFALSVGASAQTNIAGRVLEDAPWCDNVYQQSTSSREVACEVREALLEAGALDVDGATNGPIEVKEWDRDDVLVRSRIVGVAASKARAERLVDASSVQTQGGRVRSSLPESHNRESVSVSYEIFAPKQTDLTVRAVNGPLTIHGLRGSIQARAVNGPVSIQGVEGDVTIRAVNGPVSIGLEGDRWRGSGLVVRADNGPITVDVPDRYSAQVSAETQNGRIAIDDLDVCDTVRQRGRYVGDRISGRLGTGGSPLALTATNGSVRFVSGG
ncbi:hypothetical protein [Rubrivirga sp.]|uniref:hypothetical protein n=1 Tax=Rubrivirga sp. TaxID=1885344 RepID=UPI003C780ADB